MANPELKIWLMPSACSFLLLTVQNSLTVTFFHLELNSYCLALWRLQRWNSHLRKLSYFSFSAVTFHHLCSSLHQQSSTPVTDWCIYWCLWAANSFLFFGCYFVCKNVIYPSLWYRKSPGKRVNNSSVLRQPLPRVTSLLEFGWIVFPLRDPEEGHRVQH